MEVETTNEARAENEVETKEKTETENERTQRVVDNLLWIAKKKLKHSFDDVYEEKYTKRWLFSRARHQEVFRRTLKYEFAEEVVMSPLTQFVLRKKRNGKMLVGKMNRRRVKEVQAEKDSENHLKVIVNIEGGEIVKGEEVSIVDSLYMTYCIIENGLKKAIITYVDGQPESMFEFKDSSPQKDQKNIRVYCQNSQN